MDEIEAGASDVRQRSLNRRLTKVCARCRKRKVKCDFKLPACSQCEAASALPCMGYNVSLGREVPRSIVAYLESRAAELEMEIQQFQMSGVLLDATGSTKLHPNDTTQEVLFTGSTLAAALSDVILPKDQYSYARTVYTAFQRPCSLPLPFARQQTSKPEQANSQASSSFHFSAVPRAAADFMLKNYTEIHLPQYPCVYEPELLDSYRKCFDAPAEASPFDVFIVSMALAISANTLIWKNKADAYAASARFWAKAKEEFEELGRYDNDLKSLQVALLLSHYASTNPKAVDIFYCIGEAARICIHLGLHREPPADMPLNTLELDARRRLFWTTYGIERSVCSILRLPFSLNEEVVTTQYPSGLADTCITPEGFLPGPHKKASALHFWAFRKLETEVHRVLYLDKRHSGGESLDAWFIDVTARLNQWHSKALEFAPEQKLEFRNVQLYYLKGRLHRPTPINLHPSRTSRLEAVNSAMRLADEYMKQQRNERLFYPWLAVHVSFEAAIVLLDVAWNCGDWLGEHIDLREVIRYLHAYADILRKLTAVWSEVQSCLEAVETLSDPVIQRCNLIINGLEVPPPDEVTSRLLNSFLFPDSDAEPVSINMSPETNMDLFTNPDTTNADFALTGGWQFEDIPLESMFHLEENTFGIYTEDGMDANSVYLASLYRQLG